eukprot:TRINITY_DN169_c0_g1_i1.p1 TRINITY_DN169_c0_g1~~TRINITY_DN169_c0_g1_i1.p1  ORF type:complete len:459 (+),score=152.33 TRINITY_DN169_c0_g1_i1:77-1378(+)
MRPLCALLIAAGAAPAAGQTAAQWSEFKAKAQSILDWGSRANEGAAVGFAWKDNEREFQLAAGSVLNLDGTTRPLTTDDTFLYGSGSKTFTAVAIMRLVEAGRVRLEDPAEMHVDPWLLRHGNTTLRRAWGPTAANVTVGMLIAMRSGVADYDKVDFDEYVLSQLSAGVISPLEFIMYPSTISKPFVCAPGTCVEYSSTNFVLAGIVLLHHSGLDDWTKLFTKSFFSAATQHSLAGLDFFTDQPLTKWLTTTAKTGSWNCTQSNNCTRGPETTIGPQNSSIVGWTCANAVAAPREVARFFHSLLAERSVVSPDSLNVMQDWHVMTKGWRAGNLWYGSGLMLTSASFNASAPGSPTFDGWGTFIGHGGMVYGYLSEQGYFWGLNASLSLVISTDQAAPDDDALLCNIVEAAANVLHSQSLDFGCPPPGGFARTR